MEAVLEQMSSWADQSEAERGVTTAAVRRCVLAAMESGNPSVARTVLREFAEFNAAATYGLRAEVVSIYGMDI